MGPIRAIFETACLFVPAAVIALMLTAALFDNSVQ